MSTGMQCDPQRTRFPTADKITARLLFAVSATHQRSVENMYITKSYVHDLAIHDKPINIRELADIGGQYVHEKTTGRPI